MKHDDESRIDLSDDQEFSELLKRRAELSEIERAGRDAHAERVEVDTEIINRLGNSSSAIANDLIVTVETQSRREYTVEARVITFVKIHKSIVRAWRKTTGLKAVDDL